MNKTISETIVRILLATLTVVVLAISATIFVKEMYVVLETAGATMLEDTRGMLKLLNSEDSIVRWYANLKTGGQIYSFIATAFIMMMAAGKVTKLIMECLLKVADAMGIEY